MQQDGRLAPAYFSPDYKYFDQLLQTVENRTTVSILVLKEFLFFYKHQFDHWFLYFMQKGITIFRRKFFVSVPKNFVGEPFCAVFQKISGCEKVYG